MLFGPWRSSVIFALALAARPIVVLIDCFFNQPACDVRIYPLIELDPIKADTLGTDAKFPDMGSDSFVEFAAAHAEVTRCFAGAKNARQVLSDLCCCCVCHKLPLRQWRIAAAKNGSEFLTVSGANSANSLFGAGDE